MISPPTMNDGRRPAPTRPRARSDDVVVLPWVPLTATVRRSPQMAARIVGPGHHRDRPGPGGHDLGVVGGHRGGDGQQVDRDSAGPRLAASWPTKTCTPRPASRSSHGDGRRSLPDTRWPMPARTSAMALIPLPPTPTTWMRRGPAQVDRRARRPPDGTRRPLWPGVLLDEGGHPVGRVAAPGRRRRPRPHGASRASSASKRLHLRHQPVGVELAVGDEHGRAGVGQGPGVRRLVVAGGVGQGDQHRRQPHDRHLGHRVAAGPAHEEVGRGQQQLHPVLVAHRLVDEARRHRRAASAARPRPCPSPGRPPRGARPGRSGRPTRSTAPSTARLIRSAPSEPPVTATTRRPSGRPRAARAAARPAPENGRRPGSRAAPGCR